MKVLLISFDDMFIANGARTIQKCCMSNGYDAKLYFPYSEPLNSKTNLEKPIIEGLKYFEPDIIGLSVLSYNYNTAEKISHLIRKTSPKIKIVWGGWHAMVNPNSCFPYADYLCVGEGETSFIKLLKALSSNNSIKSIFGIYDSPPCDQFAPILEDLDSLPNTFSEFKNEYFFSTSSTNIERLSLKKYLEISWGLYHVFTGRGCPYNCSYCCAGNIHNLYNTSKKSFLRRRSANHIIQELEYIKRNANLKFVVLYDDEFFSKPYDFIEEFAAKYKEKINVPFLASLNPLSFKENKYKVLIEAGLSRVRMGVQNGSPRIRQIFNRQESATKIIKVSKQIAVYQKYLAWPVGYDFILDSPWETEKDLEDTVLLVSKLYGFIEFSQFKFVLLEGTELFKKAEKRDLEGFREEGDVEKYLNKTGYQGLIVKEDDYDTKKNYLKSLITVFAVYPIPSFFATKMIALHKILFFQWLVFLLYKYSTPVFHLRWRLFLQKNKLLKSFNLLPLRQ